MKSRLLAAGLLTVLLPFGAVACGADSTGELDKGELTDELVEAGMTEAQASCMADAMIDADFTKEEIDKLNGGDTEAVDSAKYEAFMGATMDCVTAG
jgi:hypothetical protein